MISTGGVSLIFPNVQFDRFCKIWLQLNMQYSITIVPVYSGTGPHLSRFLVNQPTEMTALLE